MALSLNDVNDYLAPSQICIKTSSKPETPVVVPEEVKIEIGEDTGIYYEAPPSSIQKKQYGVVNVNLDDCLACSGCVTSTETVLISSQTYMHLLDVINKPWVERKGEDNEYLTLFATVSPQTVASFSAKYLLTFEECFRRIEFFFKSLGVLEIFDSSIGRNFSLFECAKEFVERYLRSNECSEGKKNLPLFTSSCPGWICYAEKVYSDLLPLITTSKTPQQVLGSFLKDYIPKHCSIKRESIYHFSVMSCYDKKLESPRGNSTSDKVKDVDCVITSIELENMMKECKFDFATSKFEYLEPHQKHDETKKDENETALVAASICKKLKSSLFLYNEGSSSGGYQSFVMRYAAKKLFGIVLSPKDVENGNELVKIRKINSNDCVEYILEERSTNKVLLKFYRVFGFKNMQAIIRAVRRIDKFPKKTKLIPISNNPNRKSRVSAFPDQNLHFVELMACPSGCINGAGQLKNEFATNILQSDLHPLTCKAEAIYLQNHNEYVPTEADNALCDFYSNFWPNDLSKKPPVLHNEYRAASNNAFNQMKW